MSDTTAVTYDPNARGWRSTDSTLHCASPFGNCAEWYQDSRRSSFRGAIINGWTRDKQHLWLCPECSDLVQELRVNRAIDSATPRIHEQMLDRMVARIRERFEQGERFDLDLLVEFIRAQKEVA